MASFKDSAGREWTLKRITFASLDDLAAVGLDVEAVIDDFGKLATIAAKPRTFAAILWWFVGESVTAAGIEPGDFKAALDDATWTRAFEAVQESLLFFSPYPAPVKAAMVSRLREETERAMAAVVGSGALPASSPPSPASSPTG